MVDKQKRGKYCSIITSFNFLGVLLALIMGHFVVKEKWYYPFFAIIVLSLIGFLFIEKIQKINIKSKPKENGNILINKEFIISILLQALPLYTFYKITIFREDLSYNSYLLTIYFNAILVVFIPIVGILLDKYNKMKIFFYGIFMTIPSLLLIDCFSSYPQIRFLIFTFLAISISIYMAGIVMILPSIFFKSKATNLASSSEVSAIIFSGIIPYLGTFSFIQERFLIYILFVLTLFTLPQIIRELKSQ